MSSPFDISGIAAPARDSAILRNLEGYWQSLRTAQTLPARNDLAPHLIDAALPHAFILHRVAPGVARIRVAGQRIHDFLRMDARGMPFSILFGPASRDQLSNLVETAFIRPAIIAAELTAPAQMMRAPLKADMIMLPMVDDQGVTSRILGGIVTDGVIGSKQRRFDLATGAALRIEPLPVAQKPDAARPALRLVVNNC